MTTSASKRKLTLSYEIWHDEFRVAFISGRWCAAFSGYQNPAPARCIKGIIIVLVRDGVIETYVVLSALFLLGKFIAPFS
jgi:hypothetical protein